MAARRVAVNTKKVWFGHAETYPVIASAAAAVGLCAYSSATYLFKSPDVQWRKAERGSTLRQNQAEGEAWVAHKSRFIVSNVENIGIGSNLEKKYKK
eukprot:CAMPEP_0197455562 /NCGR_PEP_ID=MMETSP1175-20131217/41079_1 /TAXON_ID=1003142 /ORGANISM="Triceratium dubium, Strain CCMP147" /LENGTH=96 /DNA_ID=CAMNT_0042989441 /DNA_START=99 /DNA_END=389 /DNA_ORIENTATION=+